MEGARYNKGKARWGLLSWPALGTLVQVLEFGARKYDSWNWSKGLSWSECFESLQRHAIAWYQGEDIDPETGLSHMSHVLCNAMFLVHFILFNTGRDDRPSALRVITEGETVTDAKQEQNTGKVDSHYAVEQCRIPDVQKDVRSEDAYAVKHSDLLGPLYRYGKPYFVRD